MATRAKTKNTPRPRATKAKGAQVDPVYPAIRLHFVACMLSEYTAGQRNNREIPGYAKIDPPRKDFGYCGWSAFSEHKQLDEWARGAIEQARREAARGTVLKRQAAIRKERARLHTALSKANRDWKALEDANGYTRCGRAYDRAAAALERSTGALLKTQPTTLPGLRSFAEYISLISNDHGLFEDLPAHFCTELPRLLRTVQTNGGKSNFFKPPPTEHAALIRDVETWERSNRGEARKKRDEIEARLTGNTINRKK